MFSSRSDGSLKGTAKPSSRRLFVSPPFLRCGSAIVELLLLLPILLVIIISGVYVAWLSVYKIRTHFGAEYAMDAPGDQSEDAAARGTVSDLYYPRPSGELTVAERAPQPADFPELGEIREMFDEMSQVTYATYATGRYVFSGGRLQFIVETHQSSRLSADGQYVAQHRLRDDNIPELATALLEDWARRDRVDLKYAWGYFALASARCAFLDNTERPPRWRTTFDTSAEIDR